MLFPLYSGLNAPTGIVVTPVGTTFVANTINATTFYMVATANITAAQATGGKAELYVGSKLVATDTVITATDTTVTFTTSDATPTNAELQSVIVQGGEVTVKLYNASNQCAIGKLNGTLTVDYTAPTITGITSALYSVTYNSITLIVSGAGAVNDKVDVTKISLYSTALNKTYVLTNSESTGSKATINGQTIITIKLGSADVLGLTGFSSSNVVLSVAAGSLLSDTAGNTSASFTIVQTVPVTITN